jgi:hypothetical protein
MSLGQLLPITSSLPLARQFVASITDGLSFTQKLFDQLREQGVRAASDSAEEAGSLPAISVPVRTDHLADLADREIRDFVEQFTDRLGAIGLDTGDPIELKSTGNGEIVVNSHHPQRAVIEELLRRDLELRTAFHRAAAAGAAHHRATHPFERFDRAAHLTVQSGVGAFSAV